MGYTATSTVRAQRRAAPKSRPHPLLRPWQAALIGAAVAALATLPGLATGTLWDNSETAYGEVAREILLTHDWIVMHLNGAAWFVQPPLYFWLGALFAKAFGVGTFALRLPSALATIAMGAVVGYAGARVACPRAGIWAAVVLSTSLMQAVIGRLAIMDALLDLCVTLGILAAFRACTGGRPAAAVVGTALAIGFGVLAKGPVALAVVLLVIVPWLLWERAAGSRIGMPSAALWALGVAIVIAVDAPWFVLLRARVGDVAIGQLIGHYTFGRYLGTIENQSGPIWYYVPVIILGFFPWIAYLPGAIAGARHELRASNQSTRTQLIRLSLVWAVLPFVFFSFAQTKLPNYVALELPALGLLVGLWFDRTASGAARRGMLGATAAVPATIGALAIAIAIFARDAHVLSGAEAVIGDLTWMGAIVFVGSILSFLFLLRGEVRFAPSPLAAAALLMVLYTAIVAEPHAEPFKPIPPLAAVIRANERSGDAIAIAGVTGSNGLVFLTRPPVSEPGKDSDGRSVICRASRVFFVTSKKHDLPTYGRERRELAQADGEVLYLYEGGPCR
jgi:4-amino-4-deoxy-L-arabinose transferase-like glycosyltransferase